MTFLAGVEACGRLVDEPLESVGALTGAELSALFFLPMLIDTTAGLSEFEVVCLGRVVEAIDRVLGPLLLALAALVGGT